ncbi:MAG: flavin reductase [Opitutales bacterium]
MKKINPEEISENAINLIGKQWLLITAGNKDKFNSMTASWGCIGFMWNMPIATAMIRPQRFTYPIMENSEICTLSFYDKEHKKALSMFGTKSGKDTDKVALSGFTPAYTENGAVYYEEAKLVLECRKVYASELLEKDFIDKPILDKWYPEKDLHKMYYFEILNAYTK